MCKLHLFRACRVSAIYDMKEPWKRRLRKDHLRAQHTKVRRLCRWGFGFGTYSLGKPALEQQGWSGLVDGQ